MAAGSGDTASKYVARRETPLYIPENCTQCMECIAVCPDTALPNCSQDLETVLRTAITNYVTDSNERHKMLALLPEIETRTRALMREGLTTGGPPLQQLIKTVTNEVNGFSAKPRSSCSTSSTRYRWPTRRSPPSLPVPRRSARAAVACFRFSFPTSAKDARPRIGPNRELKWALERAWSGRLDRRGLRRARSPSCGLRTSPSSAS